MKGLVDVNSLTGIFNDCCKSENLINIGYLEPELKTSWQCTICKRVFLKKQENQQPFQSKPFRLFEWLANEEKRGNKIDL